MNFLSVCSGIEAASVAWAPLGWRAAAFSEIERFPCAVLAHHYPATPNLGDMMKFESWPHEFNGRPIDLLCGGTPCQSFSLAGLRKGLGDPRGNLMLTFGAIAARYRPRWLVWENVPGVLSSNSGRDFGAFLGMLGQLRYGFAYRILDAQYFGVAQRRRRLFVVGCLGNWRAAAAVLFERHSLQGHSAPRREAREAVTHSIAPSLTASGRGVARTGESRGQDPVVAVSQCLTTGTGRCYDAETETLNLSTAHTLRGEGFDASEDGTGRGTPLVVTPFDTTQIISPTSISTPPQGGPCHPLTALKSSHEPYTLALRGRKDGAQLEHRQDGIANTILTPSGGRGGIGVGAIAFHPTQDPISSTDDSTHAVSCGSSRGQASVAVAYSTKLHHTKSNGPGKFFFEPTAGLDANSPPPALFTHLQVRRLTPTECERLQGFPDGYTDIQPKGKPTPDGPRYKAIGNSWAVPCAR